MKNWYALDPEHVLAELESNPQGISSQEATRRLGKFGHNELIERGIRNPWLILFDQFKETMVVILIVAAIISLVLGEFKDATAILVIVVVNALLGFRQEYQAEQAMAALKKLAVPIVKVRREGHVIEISARELVPGDIVMLEAGNLVPADGRLLESVNLRVQEAALTGESEPVNKSIATLPDDELPLAERHNVVFMGTMVTYGRGRVIITDTGMNTQLGKIAELMQSAKQERTPLQVRLDQLGKGLALAAAALVAIVFMLGLFQGQDLKILVLTSIGMAVAAVPEGLPAVVTISLALGARRMLKRKALIRKLPAVEALGSVTVICSDKTGTLTENRMTVTVVDVAEHRIDLVEEMTKTKTGMLTAPSADFELDSEQAKLLGQFKAMTLLMVGCALCNDAVLEFEKERPDQYYIVGDPTEGALVIAAQRLGLAKDTLEAVFPRIAEIPFDSDRKRMTTLHKMPQSTTEMPESMRQIWDWDLWQEQVEYVAFTKGAMDGLIEKSNRVWVDNHIENLDSKWRERIERANEGLAQQGMRVLGLACRAWDRPELEEDKAEEDLIFVGLAGMIDPARAEVKGAVAMCKTAGIRPLMITGDHPLTAGYIARELGIGGDAEVLTGRDLDKMEQAEFEKTLERTSVYARVSPEHKLKIVQALQNQGQIAAMTGDGVNDAPALKKADIGVAMGIAGTDVSKEAADMVLLDDNFATIVAAVEEGRVIYDNIRRFIQYTLTSNAGEIWVMLLAPFLGMPLPLLPLQILWINLVTDGLPGLALGVEKAESDTMRRPPHPPGENIFARGLGRNVLFLGLLMGLISLGTGFLYWRSGQPTWQTMVFTTLTLSEMGYVMAIRSNRESLFTIGIFSNRALVGAVLLTTLLQLAVVYVPFLQNLFRTIALPIGDLLVCLGLSVSLFIVVEIQKWAARRRSGFAS